eukprot:COSAG01_NODE_29026_length_647_cov_0.990876_1_plen_63_part_10
MRSDFKATALYKGRLVTDATGKVTIKFQSPDNVGTWTIKAAAVAKQASDLLYATSEYNLVASR